jgi:hypothetical protein
VTIDQQHRYKCIKLNDVPLHQTLMTLNDKLRGKLRGSLLTIVRIFKNGNENKVKIVMQNYHCTSSAVTK